MKVAVDIRIYHLYIYICFTVIDFEATCENANPESYQHEIIEFPVVVVHCESKKIVSYLDKVLFLWTDISIQNFMGCCFSCSQTCIAQTL